MLFHINKFQVIFSLQWIKIYIFEDFGKLCYYPVTNTTSLVILKICQQQSYYIFVKANIFVLMFIITRSR
jgi:hypothetical protein